MPIQCLLSTLPIDISHGNGCVDRPNVSSAHEALCRVKHLIAGQYALFGLCINHGNLNRAWQRLRLRSEVKWTVCTFDHVPQCTLSNVLLSIERRKPCVDHPSLSRAQEALS